MIKLIATIVCVLTLYIYLGVFVVAWAKKSCGDTVVTSEDGKMVFVWPLAIVLFFAYKLEVFCECRLKKRSRGGEEIAEKKER